MPNIDRYRLAANITEYHIVSKLISPMNQHLKFIMMIRQLFQAKNICKNVKKKNLNA